MKSTILLTTALFLMSAPSPDSKSVSEMSGGFLVGTDETGLMASEASIGAQSGPVASVPLGKMDAEFESASVQQSKANCVVSRKDC